MAENKSIEDEVTPDHIARLTDLCTGLLDAAYDLQNASRAAGDLPGVHQCQIEALTGMITSPARAILRLLRNAEARR